MLHKFTLFEQACRNRKLSHTGTNNVVEGFLIMNDIDIEKILLGVYPDDTKSLAEIFVKEKHFKPQQALKQAEECINRYSEIMTF